MMRRLLTPLTIVVCVFFAVPVAGAPQQPAIEIELDDAKGLYQQGRLDEAIGALRSVIVKLNELRDARDRTRQLAEAHFHLGLAYLAMRNESAAIENFRQVAALDPDRVLDPEIYSPRVLSVFDEARSDVVRTLADDRAAAPPEVPVRPNESGGVAPLVQSQSLLRILPGTKIRVERAGPQFAVEGLLLAVNENALTIGASDWRVDLPRETVTRVQVVTRRKSHWMHGMLIGAGLGVLIGAVETPGCGTDGDCYTRAENIGYGGVGMGLVGTLIGALYRTDVWADVPVNRSAARSFSPQRLAVAFSWRY